MTTKNGRPSSICAIAETRKAYEIFNTYHAMGRFNRGKLMIFFLFFLENRIWYFMQIVSLGDNLHAVSNPIF